MTEASMALGWARSKKRGISFPVRLDEKDATRTHDLGRVSQNRPSERSKKFSDNSDELKVDVGVRDGSSRS